MQIEPPSESRERHLFDTLARVGFVALAIVLVYKLFHPLFPALLWGVLLAVILAHPYERFVSRTGGRRRLANAVFGIGLALLVMLPVLVFAWELIAKMPALVERAQAISGQGLPPLPASLSGLPVAGPMLADLWQRAGTDFGGVIRDIASHAGGVASWLIERLGTFGAFVLEFVLGGMIALYILNHRFALRAFLSRFLSRIGGDLANRLVLDAFETTRGAFAGVVVAATAQAVLVGLALVVAGVPGVTVLTGFTFILALVQVGPILVLVIAALFLLSQGAQLAAILLAAWFLLVVMSVDNLIRPYFTSQGADLPWGLAFLGSIGGLFSWGLIGVFVGPVLVSVLYTMLLAWVYSGDPAPPS